MLLTPELRQMYSIPEDAKFDGRVDLISDNVDLIFSKKIAHAIGLFGIDYIGGKSLVKISQLIQEPMQIFDEDFINSLNLNQEIGPDKAQKFIDGIRKYKYETGIPIEKIVRLVSMTDNLGNTTSIEFAKYLSKVTYDFKGLEKKIINELYNLEIEILEIIEDFKSAGYKIKYQIEIPTETLENQISFVLTGSPKNAGFDKKSEFVKILPSEWVESKALKSGVKYLVTDDLDSKSSKMKKASQLGIEIITYEQLEAKIK